jgi:hypothetical protein
LLVVLTTVPFSVQLVKTYPLLAIAVTVTAVPEVYEPPPAVVPAVTGLDDVVTV